MEVATMRTIPSPRPRITATALALLLAGAPALAADEDVSFKKRGDAEKQFVGKAVAKVIKAARLKPQKIALLRHEYKTPKANRTELHTKAEYYGAVTRKRYVVDIVFIIDSSNKEAWEVVNIKYADTNPSPAGPNERKIQALIPEFNK
jgi:hypothetical protein